METYCQHALDALESQAGDHFAKDLTGAFTQTRGTS